MGQPTVGSNPTLSATIQLIACAVGCIFLTWCLQEGETVDKINDSGLGAFREIYSVQLSAKDV
ncbi:MAG: hypothetical protein EGQ46_00655 [Clostridiales bacterium]|nr:hypothetical protein [Clostridiales bacterium]